MKGIAELKRYSPITIGLHWIMLILLVVTYASMELKGVFPKGSSSRDALQQIHFILGLSVLTLVPARILLNLFTQMPPVVPEPPGWQIISAKAMHVALYVLMFAVPVLGWLILSAKGQAIPFWGYDLPPLISANESLGKWLKKIHELGATTGYFLIGAHAAAALFHHYVMHDNTLVRMIPGIKGSRGSK